MAENDPKLYALRYEIVTELMRDIRKLLDETQRAQGRKGWNTQRGGR